MKHGLMVLTAAATLLAGCGWGPRQRPRPSAQVPAPPTFRGASAATASEPASMADIKWFDLFQDQELQRLIRTALARNYDLREAAARVEIARANLGVVRSEQRPTFGATGDFTTLRFSRSGNFPLPEGFSQRRTFGGMALNLLSYELDLWGRLGRATDAARADILASEENRNAVVTLLVSDVAAAYFDLLELDSELEIARRTLRTREESLQVIRVRRARGLATVLDLREGEQLANSAQQTILGVERLIEQTENRLSFLLAWNPGPIPRGQTLVAQANPPEVPPGLPSALLSRRPDIRAAEHALTSVDAMVDVARASYFPRIRLTSFLGTQSDQLAGLFSGAAGGWQFAAQLSQPIFTGGLLRSNERMAEAQEQLALVHYQRTVQKAFREVSDALVQLRNAREIRHEQESLVTTLQDRSRLAYVRYRGGVDTLLNALDADRDLFSAELQLAQARRNELVALVQLYRSLGGGWQN